MLVWKLQTSRQHRPITRRDYVGLSFSAGLARAHKTRHFAKQKKEDAKHGQKKYHVAYLEENDQLDEAEYTTWQPPRGVVIHHLPLKTTR